MSEVLAERLELATENWKDANLALLHCDRILLWGDPGTGKSFSGALKGKNGNLFRLALNNEMPAAILTGHYLPTENGFTWHNGPLTMAWITGSRFVGDEIDNLSGDCEPIFHAFLDDPESAKITLPNNETITPKEGFSFVGTTNQIPTVLPEPILDRMDAVLHIKYPNPEIFTEELGLWTSSQVREAAKRAIFLSDTQMQGQGGRRVGLRAFLSIDRLIAKGLNIEDAGRLVLGKEGGRWLNTAIELACAE